VAFLRAINVGGRVVKMADLKAIFEGLRFGDVSTFIASGNVMFSSGVSDVPGLERRIEQRLQQVLGYPVTTFVRSTTEVCRLAMREPFPVTAAKGGTLYVGFLGTSPPARIAKKVELLCTPTDDLRVDGREVYWLCRSSFADSPVSGAALEKALGMPTTLRNVSTVRRLAARCPAP
jgi:uncharacterized protein (DUF1697 family)